MPNPRNALLSVYDRTGLTDLGRALRAAGYTIYATGGTQAFLAQRGIEAVEVGELTGFPALADGRVKTLHPKVFAGILADREKPQHLQELEAHAIPRIDVVACNLYPFEATVERPGVTVAEAIEQIDIGGVSLIRAAAKNYAGDLCVLVDPAQYPAFIEHLQSGRYPDVNERKALAVRAFERVAEYDASIARYMEAGQSGATLPGSLALTMPLESPLRYGENPQARAAFYLPSGQPFPRQLQGKALSYNNLLDLDAALRLLARPTVPAGHPGLTVGGTVRVAIVKHTVPCGVAERESVGEAVRAALDADRISAFGGIVASDEPIDGQAADALGAFFLEIVAAPAFTPEALAVFAKKKNLRVLLVEPSLPRRLLGELRVRSALGGVLADEPDPSFAPESWAVVSQRVPSAGEWSDLLFAWGIVRWVKSNGAVIAKDGVSWGVCGGQTNRVWAVGIAGQRAGEHALGAVCATDGFFPFADGLEAAAAAGCTAVVAPGGSIRDAEVIAAADHAGIALVFSTHRFFLH
ncbi:bifunctional phosphoribosylaminoimidazolecarboxamide formyltransferase/IMP cyclohydrolase [bacterium]|nr:MAG: bifunctional phosphoribosylaminoimidazolecarboxamide formyltransferase/IMP cyclohydrolase [bacterium]